MSAATERDGLPHNYLLLIKLSSLLPNVIKADSPLGSLQDDTSWRSKDYIYIASTSENQLAELVSPTPGSALLDPEVTFSWSAGTGISRYRLTVGRTLGGGEIYDQEQGTNPSKTLTALPMDGEPLYVRLWSLQGSTWRNADYIFLTTIPQKP